MTQIGLADRVEIMALPGGWVADRLIVGVDLVGYFAAASSRPPIRLVTGSVTTWLPADGELFDLVTCVHGLHYVGDKLDALSRAASWLTADGIFATSFEPDPTTPG